LKSNSELNFATLNFQSLRSQDKLVSLEAFLDEHNIHVLIGTETWLTGDINDSEIFPNQKYAIYRKDRTEGKGGGVLIAVKNDLNSSSVQIQSDNDNSEQVWCSLQIPNKFRLYICSFYRPPNSDETPLLSLYDSLQNIITGESGSRNRKVFVSGDFNLPEIDWNAICSEDFEHSIASYKRPILVNALLNCMYTFNMKQCVFEPTRIAGNCSNILDLVFTNIYNACIVTRVVPGLSDHEAVISNLQLSYDFYRPPSRKTFLFRQADWDSMRTTLVALFDEFKEDCLAKSSNDIWLEIKPLLLKLMGDHIPTRNITTLNKRPWMNKQLKVLLRKQRILHSRAKRLDLDEDWDKFNLARAKASSLNSSLYNEFIQKSLNDGQYSKTFWRYIKSMRNAPGVPNLRSPDGSFVSDPVAKAEMFSSVFRNNYNLENYATENVPETPIENVMDPINISVNGVIKLLSNVNATKAAGPDGIPGRLLKSLAGNIAPYLAILFEKIVLEGSIPNDWKTALVVPIPKPGDKHNPENYRPISLTCIVSRVFERIIQASINQHLTLNKIILPTQHGFRKGLSCETQLVSIFHDLADAMDKQFETDVVFLDYRKAFDRVPYCHLISKLKALKILPNVVSIIESFLGGSENRTQSVIVEGCRSTPIRVPSGVPQGSVLGPLLFLIFINDSGLNISSNIRFFADDCCIYRIIKSPVDKDILQNDLNTITAWCSKWGMDLNCKKCVLMTVSRLKSRAANRSYSLLGSDLKKVDFYKYLGVTLNSSLTWSNHILSAISSGNRALGFVRRNLKSCSKETKLMCYKTLVRPHLEYASAAWDPFLAGEIHKLEMVQRRAARFICNKYERTKSVSALLDDLNLSTLQERRQNSRIKMFYKLDSKKIPLETPIELKSKLVNGRNDNGKAYVHFVSKSNPFFSSFYPRTVRDWNMLPNSHVSSVSLLSLSNKLNKAAGRTSSVLQAS